MKHYFLCLCLLQLVSATFAQEWIDNTEFDRQIVINDKGRLGYVEKIWKQDIKKARLLIPYQFNSAGRFDKAGHAVVEVNGKYGLIDRNGNEVIPFEYERASSFELGTAYVKKAGKYFKINRNGQKLKYADIRLAILARDKK